MLQGHIIMSNVLNAKGQCLEWLQDDGDGGRRAPHTPHYRTKICHWFGVSQCLAWMLLPWSGLCSHQTSHPWTFTSRGTSRQWSIIRRSKPWLIFRNIVDLCAKISRYIVLYVIRKTECRYAMTLKMLKHIFSDFHNRSEHFDNINN